MNKIYVKIEGIHCEHCITKITRELLKNEKIKEVKIKNNIAHITCIKKIDNEEIIKVITKIDYFTKDEYISTNLKDLNNKIELKEFIIITTIIIIIGFLVRKIFGFNIFNLIPNIDSSITYKMLFITGLLTSIHCISMCGAINLIAVVDSNKKSIKKPLLYNLGRVLSYTIIGAVAGLLGNIISINEYVQGILIIVGAIIVFLMALQMLGIIDFNIFPKYHFKIKSKPRNSFIIGILNGFMPCGPLSAMEVYALSTSSIIKGSLSMLLFGLGTVPLMLSIGLFYNLIKGKRQILVNNIASILILILSIIMLNRGLLSLGIDLTKPFSNYEKFTSSKLEGDIQIVRFDLNYSNYEDILLQVNVPAKIIIHVDEKYLTGCNNEILIKDFNINKKLEVGDNIIEFTPTKTGVFTYTCWMNMIKNNIKVIDNQKYFREK